MGLFTKPPEQSRKNPEIEELREAVGMLRDAVSDLKDVGQKQIGEVCSAINVLDCDLAELKEDARHPKNKEDAREVKKTFESVVLFGRLCMQNKEQIDVLIKRVDAIEKKIDSRLHTHTKILN